jgi:hypothetical protein
MNGIHETSLLDQPTSNDTDEYAVVELGTFFGTIYKSLYYSNGSILPSDTREQLIADRLN